MPNTSGHAEMDVGADASATAGSAATRRESVRDAGAGVGEYVVAGAIPDPPGDRKRFCGPFLQSPAASG